jgi:predicted nuclease of predicted toxin-antitoxin system
VKIKLDENMPVRLVKQLSAAGHDTDTVRFEGFSGQPDDNVWQAAQGAGRFFITQDLYADMVESTNDGATAHTPRTTQACA